MFQPLYNLVLASFFEWGVAAHDLDRKAIKSGEKSKSELRRQLRGMGHKAWRQIVKDYIAFPALSGRHFKRTLKANFIANMIRNVWSYAIIFCGHFPDQTYTFSQEEVEDETRAEWYLRQLVGAANIDGSPLFHVISGNLGYQVEHHLYPDMPASRYSEIAPKIKDICERYELPYNSGRFSKQWFMVHRTIFRLAFPGGNPRPKPGPYHAEARTTPRHESSEATRFRDRVPAEHPAAGPEHESSGVEVQPPPRGDD